MLRFETALALVITAWMTGGALAQSGSQPVAPALSGGSSLKAAADESADNLRLESAQPPRPGFEPADEIPADDAKESMGQFADDEIDDPAESTEEDLSHQSPEFNWPESSIQEVRLSLAPEGRTPEDRSIGIQGFGRPYPSVAASQKLFAWQAAEIRYQPLYFEDVPLERYGQTQHLPRQTVVSALHFGASLLGLSLQILETHPQSCDYPLGFCRPGDQVPQTTQRHFFGALSLDQVRGLR